MSILIHMALVGSGVLIISIPRSISILPIEVQYYGSQSAELPQAQPPPEEPVCEEISAPLIQPDAPEISISPVKIPETEPIDYAVELTDAPLQEAVGPSGSMTSTPAAEGIYWTTLRQGIARALANKHPADSKTTRVTIRLQATTRQASPTIEFLSSAPPGCRCLITNAVQQAWTENRSVLTNLNLLCQIEAVLPIRFERP